MLVSAPAGSGKTFLLRSWIAAEGLGDRAAWVSVGRGEHDPQAFWLSVLDSLRLTGAGSGRVRELTAAPDLDGATVVRRLLEDVGSLDERLWLVIDDLQELQADEAIRQVEVLLGAAPPQLRVVLLTRRDVRLGLHRLRVEGELTEIRGEDLRFSVDDSRALLEAAGVRLSDGAVESLVGTTEGWAAGLRLAALSLARDPDPERLAESFSGRERGVAEYLLAEVLERQPDEVTRLLLRTSILERVSGPLADRLTGCAGSERILWELEDAGAFVVSLDAERSWFRYHHLFADLLALELRRTAPGEIPSLHHTAAEWFDEHRQHVEAVREAQAAEDWDLAARVLSDHWFQLVLSGRAATAYELVAGFPADFAAGHPELTALRAAVAQSRGSFEEAGRELAVAEDRLASVPQARRSRLQVMLAIQRLDLAEKRADLPAVAQEAQRLLAPIKGAELEALGVSEERHALALISLGIAERWTGRREDAEQHLDEGIALARRLEQPYLELLGLTHSAMVANFRTFSRSAERGTMAIELAQRHGWSEEPIVGVAYTSLAVVMLARARLDEAERWFAQAQATLRPEAQPGAGLLMHYARGNLELARGRDAQALADYRAAERLARQLATPHTLATGLRGQLIQALVRLGEGKQAEQAIVAMDPQDQQSAAVRTALAALRLALNDLEAATTALAPVLDDATASASGSPVPAWAIMQACLLEARARDALGDAGASSRALERALDLAEPDGLLLPFLLHPAPELLERQSRLRTTHASLISEILNLLAGHAPAPRPGDAEPLPEPLSEAELRVLRYLPTNLRGPEIAAELFVSPNTIRMHLRHVYGKLGVHSRTDAVNRARELGLLSPSSRKR